MGEIVNMSQEILVAGEKSDQELIQEGRAIARDTEQKGISVMRSTGEWYAEVQATRKVRKEEAKKSASLAEYLSNPQMCEASGISQSQALIFLAPRGKSKNPEAMGFKSAGGKF